MTTAILQGKCSTCRKVFEWTQEPETLVIDIAKLRADHAAKCGGTLDLWWCLYMPNPYPWPKIEAP